MLLPGMEFQPTRPLRGATSLIEPDRLAVEISTHAPLAGRDKYDANGRVVLEKFQPTRPLRGATYLWYLSRTEQEFQPTRPLRGATAKVYKSLCTFLR